MVTNNFALTLQQTFKGYQDTDIIVVNNDALVNLLTIEVYNAGVEIDYSQLSSGTITFVKDDGNIVQGDLTINAGNLTYLMGTNEIAIPGTVRASIQLYGAANERLTPARFKFHVDADLVSPSAVESTTEFSILQQLKIDLEAVDVIGLTSDFNSLVSDSFYYATRQSGVDKTGVANSTAGVQMAIDHVYSLGGGVVFLPAGIFKITSVLTVPSNVKLLGAGIGVTILDYSTMAVGTTLTDAKGISLTGTKAASVAVTVSVTKGNNQITVADASTLSAGNLLILSSDELYDASTTNTYWTKSEIVKIKSKNVNVLTLYDKTIFSYDAAENAKVEKMNPIENVSIKDLSIKMGGVGSAHNAIYADIAHNINIDSVYINGAESVGVTFDYVYSGRVSNSYIEKSTSPGEPIGNTGYGVLADNSSRHITFENNIFRECRHSVAGGSMAAHVIVTGNHSNNSSDRAYDCHEPTFHWTFEGNHSFSDAGGFNVRGQYISVIGNKIVNPTSVGIFVISNTAVSAQKGITVSGNTIDGGTSNGIQADGINGKLEGLQIENNRINDAVFTGILLRNFTDAQVIGNYIKDVTGTNSDGISILGLATDNRSTNLLLSDNTVNTVIRYGFRIEYVDEVTISEPITKTCTNVCIRILGCSIVSINGGYAKNGRLNSINIQSTDDVIISGFKAFDTTDATGVGIRVATCNNVTIVNCIVKNNTGNAMYITGTDYIIVKNNDVKTNTAATKINIDGTAVHQIVADNVLA